MAFDVYRIDRTKHWGTYETIKQFKEDLSRTYSALEFRVFNNPDTIIVMDVNHPIAIIRHELTPKLIQELGLEIFHIGEMYQVHDCPHNTMVKI